MKFQLSFLCLLITSQIFAQEGLRKRTINKYGVTVNVPHKKPEPEPHRPYVHVPPRSSVPQNITDTVHTPPQRPENSFSNSHDEINLAKSSADYASKLAKIKILIKENEYGVAPDAVRFDHSNDMSKLTEAYILTKKLNKMATDSQSSIDILTRLNELNTKLESATAVRLFSDLIQIDKDGKATIQRGKRTEVDAILKDAQKTHKQRNSVECIGSDYHGGSRLPEPQPVPDSQIRLVPSTKDSLLRSVINN